MAHQILVQSSNEERLPAWGTLGILHNAPPSRRFLKQRSASHDESPAPLFTGSVDRALHL